MKPVHVELHGFFVGDFLGEVERKSERVVELEDLDSGNDVFAGLLKLTDDFFQPLQADRHHCGKALFFGLDHTRDVFRVLTRSGIGFLHHVRDKARKFVEERLLCGRAAFPGGFRAA